MSRRLLAVGGPNYESVYLPQALTTNAFGEGEIRRQKGGGRRRYEDDVGPHRNCHGRNRHFYHQTWYANNSDSSAAETASDSEITVMTSSSKGRQRQRKHSRRRRTNDDTVYKADDECNYMRRKNATDTKNCVRALRELPFTATTTVRPEAGHSGNYMEQNAATKNMPVKATAIDETAGTTKGMLRFMDTLYRTLTNVQDEMAANNMTQTRADNATKVPQITENTSITHQNEHIVRDVPQKMANYEQKYANFDMQLPQQMVYQTHISNVPTQNACYSTCNSQNAAAAQTTCKQQGEYLQRPQCATTATQLKRCPPRANTPCAPAPEMRSNCQPTRCIPQRCAFPQYLSTCYSQPTPQALHSSLPQVYMPGPSRQPLVCTRPPSAVPTQSSIQTLPPGMYQSHVEEYVLSRQQQQSAHQGTVTRESLEKATPRVGAPSQFNTNHTDFSLRRNSRDQSYRTSRQSTEENVHSLEREPHHFNMKPQPGTVSENFDLSADSLNKHIADTTYDKGTTQLKEVRNSTGETVKLNGNIQAYNSNVINSDELMESNENGNMHADVENKMNGSSGSEQEETNRRNSKTLQRESRESAQMKERRESRESAQMKGGHESRNHQQEEESRKGRKNQPEKADREGRRNEKVEANRESKTNGESKYKKKRDSISDSNTETGTEKEMLRKTARNFKKNSAEKELAEGERKGGANSISSCDSDYLRECLRRKREKNKNRRRNQRHSDSFSDSDSEETSNGYSGCSSYSRREKRRKHHTKCTPSASESNDDMEYSLSRTSCKELKKCCSRIVAICRMARDTAATQTEQWDEGALLRPQRSNKLVDCLPKSIADGLAAANPRVMQQIMQLNRDRRRCRVCACGVLDDTGAPVVKDDMIILKFDENKPKLPTRMCMECRSHCTCNCDCKLSDTESEIIREIIRKKRLREKSNRISALTQSKYDTCDCHSACAILDDQDEREFIENLLRRQRRNRERERDRTQAQNINEDCVCDCASKAKELAAEIMHEMVKSHIQKIVTDELQQKTHSPPEPENVSINSSETITSNEPVSEESIRSKPRAAVYTYCDCANRPKVRPKAKAIKQQAGVCTCDSCGSSLAATKVRKTTPQRYGCTCKADESRTVLAKSKKTAPKALKCTCDVVETPTPRPKTERIKPKDSPRASSKSERTKIKPQTIEYTCTCNSDDSRRASAKIERTKPQIFECTCETDDSETVTPESERIITRPGVCTCDSDEIPTVTTKSERVKPRMFDCTCASNESRTVTQTFTRTIELLSGGAPKNEMVDMKRQSNDSSEKANKKRTSAKKHGINSKRSSKSAEDNEDEYMTMMPESMATERKSEASFKGAVRKSGQESRRSSLDAQRESYSDKNSMEPQVNSGSSSGEQDDKLEIKNSADEEFVPPSYYKDQMMAQRKITVRSYKAGPVKPTNDELRRCKEDCACRETPKIENVEEKAYEQKIKAQPRSIKTVQAKKDLRTCRADCACKQAVEPVFNDTQEYALSNARNMERTMVPEYKLSEEENSLGADSVQESIQKLIIDIKASKNAHASCTVAGYPKSNKNAKRNTKASLEREAQSFDSDMLMEQRAALCAELTMNELLPQHSLRTLLTKLSSPDGKLYATDEFNAQDEESLCLAKMNQSKLLNMSRAVKRKLSPTTVMTQSMRITGKQSKPDTVAIKVPRKLVSETRQLKPPNNTPSLADSRGLSADESVSQQQQHKTAPVINRRDGLSNKFARKSLIPLPVNSNTWRALKQAKSISKRSSAEERANTRPLIDQTSDSNHQITRLWPEQAATAAQRLKHETGHAQIQSTSNGANERKLSAKQLTKSQSNIEFSYGLSFSTTRPRLESGRNKELSKISCHESSSSAVRTIPTRKTENTKESLGNAKPDNPDFKMVNILSAANQCPTSSSGLSSESCQTNDSQPRNEQRCARCRAFYRKTGAHRNLKELQGHTNGRLNYVPQTRTNPTFIPATIHATPKHRRHTERYSITDDEQTDSDIECITVEYSGSEGDSYAQYQEELLRKQQLWRKGTVREALEVEEREERARNLQRTTLTGECLERAIHYPTRVWNEERRQLNLQRNGAGLFAPF